ncbi:hypothetical protein FOMPIDRAFT_1134382 [Fomitopsis schrenkii]|uniref:DUF6533 domain-containing protein n=1 Tax=Fomitopsis schrenkii TaxID=2126942 RepID=S8DT54_FOMSC|nr:hypothetical protein FOMPIDRAFT_1134382 [Fomitopsis schrenkii]
MLIGSSAVLMLYDHALSLGTEVALVWRGKWTLLSVIMTVDIYVREIGLVLLAIGSASSLFWAARGADWCTSLLIFILFYGMLIAASVNSIVLYRVYRLWDDRKTVARTLIGGFITCYAATLVFSVLTGIHLSPGMQFLVDPRVCSFARKSFYTSIMWSWIVLYDLCVLVLLFVRILGSPRKQNSQFIGMLYRDGFLTFLVRRKP